MGRYGIRAEWYSIMCALEDIVVEQCPSANRIAYASAEPSLPPCRIKRSFFEDLDIGRILIARAWNEP